MVDGLELSSTLEFNEEKDWTHNMSLGAGMMAVDGLLKACFLLNVEGTLGELVVAMPSQHLNGTATPSRTLRARKKKRFMDLGLGFERGTFSYSVRGAARPPSVFLTLA